MINKTIIFPLKDNKAPAVPKGTDWREYNGAVDTAMIGVMIPKGVFIIDVDTYKGVKAQDIEAELGCVIDWDDAILQNTLNGGVHYAFRVPDEIDLPNTTNLLGVNGIDSRSSGKGYIATGKGYEDLTLFGVIQALNNPDSLPVFPTIGLQKIQHRTINKQKDDVASDLMAMVISQPLELSDNDVDLYLSKLTDEQASNQDQWLRVGMALFHQYNGQESGWELFDQFSQRSPHNYDQRANRRRWESFANRATKSPVTFASVITMAGGRTVVEVEKAKSLVEKIESVDSRDALTELLKEAAALHLDTIDEMILVKAFKKAFRGVLKEVVTEADVRRIIKRRRPRKIATYHEDYVYLTQTGEFMERTNKTTIGERAFNMKHDTDTPTDGEGNPQRASEFSKGQIEVVFGAMYAPQFGDAFTHDGIDYINNYRPNTLLRVDHSTGEVVDVVKRHIAHLLPDPREQMIVIDYLAHNVQFAGVKIHWAIILQGVQGDGKSFISEMMKHVLGQSNCTSINVETLDEKYTPWSEGNQMVFIEELKLDNYKKYETLNKLKPYITNPTVSVRRMRTDVYEAINTTNYFALTNFKDALPIDENDRRYCVLFSQWQSKKALQKFMQDNPDYYPKIYDIMRNGAGEILDWLLTHKITPSFMKATTAPETDAKSKMVDSAKSDGFLLVEDAIAAFECEEINDEFINITELQRLLKFDMNREYDDFPQKGKLNNILVDLGYHYVGRYKNNDRKNQRIYAKDDQRSAVDFKPK
jgi:hypothetical protein